MAKTIERQELLQKLSKDDIQLLDEDIVMLKGHRFYKPYIKRAAINDDTIQGNGDLGSIMLAQESAHGYSGFTGLPKTDQQVFIVLDDAKEIWEALRIWLKASSVQIMETRIPNEKFTSLFQR